MQMATSRQLAAAATSADMPDFYGLAKQRKKA